MIVRCAGSPFTFLALADGASESRTVATRRVNLAAETSSAPPDNSEDTILSQHSEANSEANPEEKPENNSEANPKDNSEATILIVGIQWQFGFMRMRIGFAISPSAPAAESSWQISLLVRRDFEKKLKHSNFRGEEKRIDFIIQLRKCVTTTGAFKSESWPACLELVADRCRCVRHPAAAAYRVSCRERVTDSLRLPSSGFIFIAQSAARDFVRKRL